MRFEILGPMRVQVGDRPLPLPGELERALLATLLLSPNQTVSTGRLVEVLWDGAAQRNTRGQLQSCVSRLRKRLAAGGIAGDVITTDPDGYRVRVEPDTLDVLEFRTVVAQARAAARNGRTDAARDSYRSALNLWRGPALGSIRSEALGHATAALEEEHAQVLAECIEAELALGAGGELVSELTELVHRFPYQERLHAALMLSLYRAERQADALAAYRRVRDLLVSELGQEPGPVLRELHQRILTGDVLESANSDSRGSAATPAGEQCLPRVITAFTGREQDVDWLLTQAGEVSACVSRVLVIDGMPGVGKTTLAVRTAHQLKPNFPDGQLFVDLQGHSDAPPLEPSTALATLLGQLGVPSGQIPTDLDGRLTRWRTAVADRRVLVVLDNAASGAQINRLLPPGGGCLTLITSRHRMLDLDDARPHSLDPLEPDEAVLLLERIAGDRVRAEAEVSAEVAKACGYLPLALRLAATRLAHRPLWQVQDLAHRLADPHARFTELAAGERTLAGAFTISYDQLSPEGQRVLRMVGLHPANSFDTYAVAAVAGTPLPQAQRVLDELVDAHLVEEPRAGRYRLHDLVRTFASILAVSTDPEPERHCAVQWLLDHYLHAAVTATANLDSPDTRENLQRDLALGPPTRPELLELPAEQGFAWIERERPTLVAALDGATTHGHWRHAWQLATLWRFLARRGYLADVEHVYRHGLTAAEQLGDSDAVATMRVCLAFACSGNGRHDEAIEHQRAVVAHRQAIGERTDEIRTRLHLVLAYYEAGRYSEAADECERVLELARKSGTLELLATAVINAGDTYLTLGRFSLALRHSRNGLVLAREAGNDRLTAIAACNVGAIRARLGDLQPATCLLRAARRACQRVNDRIAEAEAITELGTIDRMLGNHERAVAQYQEALSLLREANLQQRECVVYNELGRTWLAAGDATAALELHQRALQNSQRIRYPAGEARALDGIATCLRDSNPGAASQHWRRALALYQQLDLPERTEVESELAKMEIPSAPGSGGPT